MALTERAKRDLNTMLDLPEGATKEKVLHAINEKHILTEAILVGRYNRQNDVV